MAIKPTNKSQYIHETADDDVFLGGNAADDIFITGDGNWIDGGFGNDLLGVFGVDNTLLGDNGDDVLSVASFRGPAANNTMDGGRGNDTFQTLGAFGSAVAGIGALITGGQGTDQFMLRQNSDVLLNNLDSYGNASIEEGDTIQGVFDVITDYTAGELIDIGVSTLRTDPIGLTHHWAGHSHLTLGDDEYAFVHGDWDGTGQFVVAEEGADLMLVYDLDPANEYYFEYGGSVVLVGVSDASLVNIGSIGA